MNRDTTPLAVPSLTAYFLGSEVDSIDNLFADLWKQARIKTVIGGTCKIPRTA